MNLSLYVGLERKKVVLLLINIREELIEVVDEFKYLGSTITSRVGGKEDRGGIWAELEAREKAASKAFGM